MAVRKPCSPLFCLLLTMPLCSCAVSLGVFESKKDGYKTYYESFGEVRCLYDGGEISYDVEKSLFNDKTMNQFSWEKEEDTVKDLEYLYLVVPFETSLKVETIAFYVYSHVNIALEMSLFYFESSSQAPSQIKYLTSPATRIIYDDDGNPVGEEEIVYDDPPIEASILHGEKELTRDGWTSVGFGNFKQQGYEDQYLHTGKDGFLYLRIENNSGWNVDRLNPVSFYFVNWLVRAV